MPSNWSRRRKPPWRPGARLSPATAGCRAPSLTTSPVDDRAGEQRRAPRRRGPTGWCTSSSGNGGERSAWWSATRAPDSARKRHARGRTRPAAGAWCSSIGSPIAGRSGARRLARTCGSRSGTRTNPSVVGQVPVEAQENEHPAAHVRPQGLGLHRLVQVGGLRPAVPQRSNGRDSPRSHPAEARCRAGQSWFATRSTTT
jgi:hypothetical protein